MHKSAPTQDPCPFAPQNPSQRPHKMQLHDDSIKLSLKSFCRVQGLPVNSGGSIPIILGFVGKLTRHGREFTCIKWRSGQVCQLACVWVSIIAHHPHGNEGSSTIYSSPNKQEQYYIYIYVCVYTYGHLYLSGMRLVRCASIRNMHPSTTHTCLKEIGLHVQSVSTIMDPIVNMIQGTYMTIQ